jgi:uncharacterized membrane protein YkvA (DUF1232 family)
VDGTTLLVILGVVALVMALLVVGTLIWVVKNRPPGKGLAATVFALAYAISPVDVVPEALLGPIGLFDDLAVVVATILYVRNTIAEVRRTAATGQPYQPLPRRRTRGRAVRGGVPRQDEPPNRSIRG